MSLPKRDVNRRAARSEVRAKEAGITIPLQPPTEVRVSTEPVARESFFERHQRFVKAVWWCVFLSVVGMTLVSIPLNLRALQRACVTPACVDQQLGIFEWRSWLGAGLSPQNYALFAVGLPILVSSIFLIVAVILFRGKPGDRVVYLTSLTLIFFGGSTFSGALGVLGTQSPLWWIPVLTFDYLGSVMIVGFFYTFPTGKFVPPWTRFVLLLWAGEQFLEVLNNPPLNLRFLPSSVVDVSLLAAVGIAIYAQVYRYRRQSNAEQRRQTKWVVFGTITALVGFVTAVIVSAVLSNSEPVAAILLGGFWVAVAMSLIPISIGIALMRARLWDIDLIINRTLVYGMITAILAGVLAVSSDLTKRLFVALTGSDSELAPIIATLIVVAAFEPVKNRVQALVDRYVKYSTGSFGVFGEELTKFVELNEPEELLKRFLSESVRAFGAQGGAVYLGSGAKLRLVQSMGEWKNDGEMAMSIEHDGTALGLLTLGARNNGDAYQPDDHKTLTEMSSLVGRAILAARGMPHDPA